MRREFSKATKIAGYERSGGQCEATWDGVRCPTRFGNDRTPQYDHIDPDAHSKDNSLSNLQVLCIPCHRHKTSTQDVPAVAKSRRIREKAMGIRANSGRKMR